MSNEEKLEKIADIMDIEVEDLQEDAHLSDYEEWDSVAILSFIALMDEQFSKAVPGATIKQFITIKDVMNAMEK